MSAVFDYLKVLEVVHAILRPKTYVEIGCAQGASLALSRCPAIGIDPKFAIIKRLAAPTRLYRETSDKFFKSRRLSQELGGPFDLAFIDGLHLAEVAFRDFVNLERYSSADSVVLLDDVLPSDLSWATRIRSGKQWTGDVYKVPILLRTKRPDLSIEIFDVRDKGLAIISRLSRKNSVLRDQSELFQAMLSGTQFQLDSTKAIRDVLRPRPISSLVEYLTNMATRRSIGLVNWNVG